MSKILELFNHSQKNSTKWKKYFKVYDDIFKKYQSKKITFVEVGILDGGSLELWKNFFHKDSRIIGVDFNPECKKLNIEGVEIVIGDQSDENFWDNFFKNIGKIDILLDDGGHTNLQQITTTIKSIKNINDDGMLVIEDTHTSYQSEFNNPSSYSFINFSKKLIDDLNYKHPNMPKFRFSLNDFIYSIQYFESLVVFNINRKETYINTKIYNLPRVYEQGIKDFRYKNSLFDKFKSNRYTNLIKKLIKIKLLSPIYKTIILVIKKINGFIDKKKYKKYFK